MQNNKLVSKKASMHGLKWFYMKPHQMPSCHVYLDNFAMDFGLERYWSAILVEIIAVTAWEMFEVQVHKKGSTVAVYEIRKSAMLPIELSHSKVGLPEWKSICLL